MQKYKKRVNSLVKIKNKQFLTNEQKIKLRFIIRNAKVLYDMITIFLYYFHYLNFKD